MRIINKDLRYLIKISSEEFKSKIKNSHKLNKVQLLRVYKV